MRSLVAAIMGLLAFAAAIPAAAQDLGEESIVACQDGLDNDGDGLVDCADPDCAEASNCVGLRYGIPY